MATLPPTSLQEKLKWSLENGKPFRRFQDTLAEDQALRKRWFEFHHEAMQKIALAWLADHHIEPTEPGSPAVPSLLDQEAEALATSEEEGNHDDAGEDEFEGDSNDELEEFDEDEEGEPVDFLSEEEEALLTEFVESLPGANFSLAKLHGITEMSAPEMLRQPENALDGEIAWAAITRISELVPLIHAYWAFESALDGYLADRE